mgnify:FL=1
MMKRAFLTVAIKENIVYLRSQNLVFTDCHKLSLYGNEYNYRNPAITADHCARVHGIHNPQIFCKEQ